MAKYIPLDAVLAEIEKIIADETESIKCFERRRNVSEVQRSNARIGVLMHLRSRLDTLEVKEVDGQKEMTSECPFKKVGCEMYKGHILECKGECCWVIDRLKQKQLKAQKGE